MQHVEQDGSIEHSHVEQDGLPPMPKDRGLDGSSLSERLQPKPDCVLAVNESHAPSLGLVLMTQWKNNGFRQST